MIMSFQGSILAPVLHLVDIEFFIYLKVCVSGKFLHFSVGVHFIIKVCRFFSLLIIFDSKGLFLLHNQYGHKDDK